MESIYTELALYGSKNECARTDDVFSPISEVCDGTVSLMIGYGHRNKDNEKAGTEKGKKTQTWQRRMGRNSQILSPQGKGCPLN